MGFKDRIAAKIYTWLPLLLPTEDSESSNTMTRFEKGFVKKLGLRFGDVTSKDFEPPEFDFNNVKNGYNGDGYIRQGVDKYVDQIFKEGYEIFSKNEKAAEYISLRLAYIAESTGVPTEQLMIEIAEDVVKYANCIIVKARTKDPSQIPPGMSLTGLYGMEPIAGYFLINPTTVKVKRDKNGGVLGWQQEVDGADKPAKFKKEDVVHFYYKKERGNAFGTPFLIPVIDDVKALRQAEENALRMLYRNIYPFYHVKVGSKEMPGMSHEINEVRDNIDNMNIEGGIVTTSRVEVKSIAADKVVDSEPYLRYLEERVFSGLGIPSIMFGRGGTANRSTGDNMTSEMSDRIKAIQKTIEMFFNHFVLRELLLEGGFDPVLNPDDMVKLQFHENDLDKKVKLENHAIYQYEHNAISESEMRGLLGRDPIQNRNELYLNLVDRPKAMARASLNTQEAGTKETNNKNKPKNQHGTKNSPKRQTNSIYTALVLDAYENMKNEILELSSKAFNLTENQDVFIGQIHNSTIGFLGISLALVDETIDAYTEYDICKDSINELMKNLCDSLYAGVVGYIKGTIKDYDIAINLIDSLFDLIEDDVVSVTNNPEIFKRKEDKSHAKNGING